MNKVFIVVKTYAYEGDTIERVFAKYADAANYSDELTAADALRTCGRFVEYDVCEREIY
jgi:hypothetical protein